MLHHTSRSSNHIGYSSRVIAVIVSASSLAAVGWHLGVTTTTTVVTTTVDSAVERDGVVALLDSTANEVYAGQLELRVYAVKNVDVDDAQQMVFEAYPDAVPNIEGRTNYVHVFTTPQEHEEIGAFIQRLDRIDVGP